MVSVVLGFLGINRIWVTLNNELLQKAALLGTTQILREHLRTKLQNTAFSQEKKKQEVLRKTLDIYLIHCGLMFTVDYKDQGSLCYVNVTFFVIISY